MTELERACEEIAFNEHCETQYKLKSPEKDVVEYHFKRGYRAALKRENMKLTEEVKGMVREIKSAVGKIDNWSIDNDVRSPSLEIYLMRIERALKPFEKESK